MPNPSLADLDAGTSGQQQQNNDNDPNKGQGAAAGAGTGAQDEPGKTAADLEAARQQQVDADAAKAEADAAAAKAAADANKGGDADEEPEGTIWDEVDALRGEKLEVKWEDEQGVIPEEEWDTPRGVIARERALESRAIQRFEESIMERDPRGYQYLLHREAGGTDEDFFAKKTITLPAYDTFKENVDLQVSVYAASLRNAGVGEKQIKQLTETAVKDKEIFELADAAYKKQEADETRSIQELNAQLERDKQQYERNVQSLNKTLTEYVASKDMAIVVPEAKREEFLNFVRRNIQYDQGTGRFLFAQPIDVKQLPRQLEALFLQFSGGNINGLVVREAQSANTRRLRRSIERSKEVQRTQADTSRTRKTLGEL